MMHKATIIKKSISKSTLGVSFKSACCDHEMPHLIDNCHLLTPEALEYKIEQLLRKHATHHSGMDTVESHLQKLAAPEPDIMECDHCK